MDCDAFEAKVAGAISRNRLLSDDGRPVIVGLSGGADSVALLAVLCSLGYKCMAVHCNFHLRGEEAMRDQCHAQSVASGLNVPCVVVDFDTRGYMKLHGVSLEMACRELRYKRFAELMAESGAQAIAVAHHRDDNVETFFLNLLRGTGIRGLRGMLPRNGDVVRPLLGVTRNDIEHYLRLRGLTYVVDSTNTVNDTVRNRLRNIVLPALRREFPDADSAIAATMDILRDNERVYMSAIDAAAVEYVSDGGSRIDIDRMVSDRNDAVPVLFELLRGRGFNASQVADMVGSRGNSGRSFRSGSHEALINRGQLIVRPLSDIPAGSGSVAVDVTDAASWPVECRVEFIAKDDFSPLKGDAGTLYLDAVALAGDAEWTVREWRSGDRIKPFGMRGSRKLSDIFSDAKLSVADKERVRVLVRNGEILWVIGIRASRLFPVTEKTERIIKITLDNSNHKD